MAIEQDILRQVPALLVELSGLNPEIVADPSRKPEERFSKQLDKHPKRRTTGVMPSRTLRLGDRILIVEAKSNAGAGVIAAAAERLASEARRLGPDIVPVLAVPFMGEVGRRACEKAGVGFIDLSGNAHIKAPPLVIHVEGRPNRFIRRGRPSSVFAPTSSRITRLLLMEPKRWWKQGELAEAGDLRPGYVSRICKRLETDQLVDRNSDRAIRPRDPELLLEAWRRRYDFESHHIIRGHVPARTGEELTEQVASELTRHGIRHALTGLAAAWRFLPFASYRLVTVYMEDAPDERMLESLQWKPGDRGANLWLVRPNDEGVFHGAAVVKGINCVSPVQTYLDLQDSPERSDEAAAHIRNELLRWK